MATIRGGIAPRELRVLLGIGATGGMTDGELLERFMSRRDECAELAFGAIVDRHGPMVRRVCLGSLGDPNDADDAFQATFLVLARKARSLCGRDSIGPWLHEVARRLSARSRVDAARRRRLEGRVGDLAPTVAPAPAFDDSAEALHEEVDRLPDRFRAPIVLCYFEGLTHEQAADRLHWPVGTVRSRLARGRDRLRAKLDRRGVCPSMATVAAGALRPSLVEATAQAAARLAVDAPSLAASGTSAAALSRELLRMMLMKTLLKTAAATLAFGLVAAGAAGLVIQPTGRAGEARPPALAPAAPTIASRPAPVPAEPTKSEAEEIAEGFLKAGSDLFDAKDAAGLAATYSVDGEIHLINQDQAGGYADEVKYGRGEVESFYAQMFRDAGGIDSANTVEFARLIAPDLLVVHGRFRVHPAKKELPFVQMRVKQGDDWLLSKLWLFLAAEEE